MSAFTFSSKEILNSALLQAQSHQSSCFTIKTKSGLLGRKKTTLTPSSSYAAPAAVINWRKKRFEIGGTKRTWAEVQHSSWNIFRSGREWQWSRQRYTVRYHDRQWIAASKSGAKAILTLRRSRIFRASKPASFMFSGAMSVEDMVFLLLVLLYSETSRKDRKERDVKNVEAVTEIVSTVVQA